MKKKNNINKSINLHRCVNGDEYNLSIKSFGHIHNVKLMMCQHMHANLIAYNLNIENIIAAFFDESRDLRKHGDIASIPVIHDYIFYLIALGRAEEPDSVDKCRKFSFVFRLADFLYPVWKWPVSYLAKRAYK